MSENSAVKSGKGRQLAERLKRYSRAMWAHVAVVVQGLRTVILATSVEVATDIVPELVLFSLFRFNSSFEKWPPHGSRGW